MKLSAVIFLLLLSSCATSFSYSDPDCGIDMRADLYSRQAENLTIHFMEMHHECIVDKEKLFNAEDKKENQTQPWLPK
jgi:hypothetical protein